MFAFFCPFSEIKAQLSVSLATIVATCGNDNGSITVTVTGGTAPYQYSLDGLTFQNSNFFTVGQGSYKVTVKDANGLQSVTNIMVGNIAGPQIDAAVPTQATCAGNDGTVTVTGTGGTPPLQYSLDGVVYANSGNFTKISPGDYVATIKDRNGCIASQPVVVPLNNTLTVDAGSDITICEGKSAKIPAKSNALLYSWAPSTGLSDPTVLQPQASPGTTTLYSLTATWGVCKQTASVTVLVNPAPVAVVGPDITICYGKSAQLNGSGGEGYSWTPALYLDNPATADPMVGHPQNTTTYHLTVTDAKGCQSIRDATETVTVTPPGKIFVGDDTSVLAGQPVPLKVIDLNNSGFTQFEWTPAGGLNDPSVQDPVATVNESTTYTVVASTADGCAATSALTIKVYSVSDIFVPNAFTPNGDGHNDILRVIPVGMRELKYFAVFNRWGQRVFYSSNPSAGWDGTMNGQRQETGTYTWMAGGINYNGDPVARKGVVILIR